MFPHGFSALVVLSVALFFFTSEIARGWKVFALLLATGAGVMHVLVEDDLDSNLPVYLVQYGLLIWITVYWRVHGFGGFMSGRSDQGS